MLNYEGSRHWWYNDERLARNVSTETKAEPIIYVWAKLKGASVLHSFGSTATSNIFDCQDSGKWNLIWYFISYRTQSLRQNTHVFGFLTYIESRQLPVLL